MIDIGICWHDGVIQVTFNGHDVTSLAIVIVIGVLLMVFGIVRSYCNEYNDGEGEGRRDKP